MSLLSLVRINLPVIQEATEHLLLQGDPKVPVVFEMTKCIFVSLSCWLTTAQFDFKAQDKPRCCRSPGTTELVTDVLNGNS
jgi:hypothetical protein